ncbi:MAG: efflux RND transporter permease subunit [Desulfurivibrio sp.]|nr:efflux RND transporter permease subunit [Desulfurivibrio sp.]
MVDNSLLLIDRVDREPGRAADRGTGILRQAGRLSWPTDCSPSRLPQPTAPGKDPWPRADEAGVATVREAVIEAGSRRFRPIMLTSLTTFFGLFPMILETSVQAQFPDPQWPSACRFRRLALHPDHPDTGAHPSSRPGPT